MSMSFKAPSRWAPGTVATAAIVALSVCARVTSAAPNCTFACLQQTFLDDPCPHIYITSQADADSWGQCGNLTGDVIIQDSSNTLTNLTLSGFTSIGGNLIVSDSSELIDLSAPNLTIITKSFTLSNLTSLTTVKFPLLSAVGSYFGVVGLKWDTLPLLTDVELNQHPEGHLGWGLGSLSLSNTGLESLEFFKFPLNAYRIVIKDNPQLNNITSSSDVKISNLEISNNGPSLRVAFKNMTAFDNAMISNVASIELPSLLSVLGNFTWSNNTFETFSAPQLRYIEGAFHITDNVLLKTLDLPALEGIGSSSTHPNDFVVSGNTNLHNITLDALTDLNGNIVLTGDFDSIHLPHVYTFLSQLLINSTNPQFDCTFFDRLASTVLSTSKQGNNLIAIKYNCSAFAPGSQEDTATHYKPPSTKKQLSKGVIAVIIIVAIVALFIFGLLCLKWWSQKHAPAAAAQNDDAGLDLDDLDGHVREEADVDRPPLYKKVGKPGEVPPGYDNSSSGSGHEGVEVVENPAPQVAEPQRAVGE